MMTLDLSALIKTVPLTRYTRQTHETMVLGYGSAQDSGSGAVLKIICDPTGGIIELPSTMDGMPLERYEKCRFCGWEFYPDKVIDMEPAELLVETDHIDAWPALPWWPE